MTVPIPPLDWRIYASFIIQDWASFPQCFSTNIQNHRINKYSQVIDRWKSCSAYRWFGFLSFGLRQFILVMHTNNHSYLQTLKCWNISNNSIRWMTLLLLIDGLRACFGLRASIVFPTHNSFKSYKLPNCKSLEPTKGIDGSCSLLISTTHNASKL